MIVDIAFIIIGFMLSILVWIFGSISYAIPSQIPLALSFFINKLGYLRGVFPMDTLMLVIIDYIAFVVSFYVLKVGLYLFGFIPWFGRDIPLPTISDKVGEN